jgi:hypothetical protein
MKRSRPHLKVRIPFSTISPRLAPGCEAVSARPEELVPGRSCQRLERGRSVHDLRTKALLAKAAILILLVRPQDLLNKLKLKRLYNIYLKYLGVLSMFIL